jgi:O-antigen/teichoic acid export membrane protein
LIPDLLIKAWIGAGYRGSYSVMAILAGVLLVHQPIYVLTQFLIARGRQRTIAIVSIVITVVNLLLSFLLAWTWGLWGVALSTLVTDLVMLGWVVPRIVAPAAATSSGALARAVLRPLVPALGVAAIVLVGIARWWHPDTLVELAPLGALWLVLAAAAIWRYGLAPSERAQFGREFWRRSPADVAVADV